MHAPILPLLWSFSFAIILMLPVIKAKPTIARSLHSIGLGGLCFIALYLFNVQSDYGHVRYLLGDWPEPFGIVLHLDSVSAFFVMITAVVALLAGIYSMAGEYKLGSNYFALFHFQLFGILGAFLTGDLFNLFVFFEVLLIASYGLLLQGGGKTRTKAALHYVVLNLIGSAIFLFALALCYSALGTLQLNDMASKISALDQTGRHLMWVAVGFLLIVFALKAAIFPLHWWLSHTYSAAPIAIVALFCLMTKVGIYSIWRVVFSLYPHSNAFTDIALFALFWCGIIGMLLASNAILGARSLQLMNSYSIGLSMSILAVATGLQHQGVLAAAYLYVLHSTLISAGFFMLVGIIAQLRGKVADRVVPARAIAHQPLLALMFMIFAMMLVGLPPWSGALSKIWLAQQALQQQQWLFVSLLIASSLVMLIALSRAGSTIFWRSKIVSTSSGETIGIHRAQWFAVGLVVVISLLITICGEFLMRWSNNAVAQLFGVVA
jgi:multicomponent K+:H+ antiporter subunit D